MENWSALIEALDASLTLRLVVGAVLGLIAGSTITVVTYRLPRQLAGQANHGPFPLDAATSHCPHCGHPLGPMELIPLLSYIVLRGRCAHCEAPIPVHYPMLEGTAAALTAATAAMAGLGLDGLVMMAATWFFIALAATDLVHYLLPDHVTQPLLWIGLLGAALGLTVEPSQAIYGACLGFGILHITDVVYVHMLGRNGMGGGDKKFAAAIGALVGPGPFLIVLFLAGVLGIIGAAIPWFEQHADDRPAVSFGPFLALAGWVVLIWGEPLSHWLLNLI